MTEYRRFSVSRYLVRYITVEVLYGFLLGTVIFLSIMLLFQAIRLSEFLINQQVSLWDVGRMAYFLMLSFLPVAIPIAFLFSVLMGISRANSEGEIMGLQVSGISLGQIYRPVLFFSLLLSGFCLYTSMFAVPKGNRGFELLITKLGSERIIATLKPGVFMEGFYGLTLFAETVSTRTNEMKKVFIYDSRDDEHSFAISAQRGKIKANPDIGLLTLRLFDGAIYVDKNEAGGIQQKISFDIYDVNLDMGTKGNAWRDYSMPSLTYPQIQERLTDAKKGGDDHNFRRLSVELHRRFSMAFACVIFGAMGFFIATLSVKGIRSSAIVLCLGVGVIYWLSYLLANAMAIGGWVLPWLGIWAPNVVFLFVPIFCYHRYNTR